MTDSRTDSQNVSIDPHLPITYGRLLDFPENPIACMRQLYETHGTLAALQEEDQKLVFIFGPEYNQQVLSDCSTFHSRFFAVRGPKNSSHRRVTSGLLSMNGEEHKLHRRMVMSPFQKRSIVNYHDSICEMTNDLLDGWRVGQTVDMHHAMTQFMLRVTCAILFGLDQPAMAYRLGEMIDRWVHMNHETGMGAFLSDPRFLSNYDELLGMAEELEADIRNMIAMKRDCGAAGHDVLSLLMQAHEDGGQVTDDELVGHIALLFGAAHLTSAHTFTWTLFLLAQHPSIMRPLYEEVASTLRGKNPTQEEVLQMPLLERVIKESMRIIPASGYSQRICAEPATLGPLHLSRGTPIVFSQFITHHMPELYDRPEQFDPDRWLSISPSPYAYLPFGNGPRMCIGAPLAMMIFKTALPAIIKRYKLTVASGAEINGQIISTMLGPTTSVPMHVAHQDGRFQSSYVTGNVHDMVELTEMPAASTIRRHAA